MKTGTMTGLAGEEELKTMNDVEEMKKFRVLKCPRFWQISTNADNLRMTSFGGRVKYDTEWGYVYNEECKICKTKSNECKGQCKHRNLCKLYVIKNDEGVVRIK